MQLWEDGATVGTVGFGFWAGLVRGAGGLVKTNHVTFVHLYFLFVRAVDRLLGNSSSSGNHRRMNLKYQFQIKY